MAHRFLIFASVAAVLLAGCGGGASDKAGGDARVKHHQFTVAYVGSMPAQVDRFREKVNELSDGALGISYREGWRAGRADYEVATVRDVAAGRIEMAVVGARAFDRVGVTSFQPLLAPLLVDSYALERKVFEAGIPRRMLAGVTKAGVVGVAILPGPMRKLLGVTHSFREPRDFAAQAVGLQDSALSAATLKALGASPRPVPSEADLNGLDGYEQQLDSIAGNEYDSHADSLTADLNLWPRPLVLVMNRKAFASLTPAQRKVFEHAAAAAIAPSIDTARNDDREAVTGLCNRGIAFEHADVGAIRRSVAGVLAASPVLEEITRLKESLDAPADAPGCGGNQTTGTAAPVTLPQGSFETTITMSDVGADAGMTGRSIMRISPGKLTIGAPGKEPEYSATYSVYRDRVVVRGEDVVKARFSYRDGQLRFTDVQGAKPYAVTWGAHPWRRVGGESSPLDGRWEFRTTKDDLRRVGFDDVVLENYGHQVSTLRNGHFRFDQDNGPTCDTWTTGTYTVRGDTLTFRVEHAGGRAPHGTGPDSWLAKPGEVWTYRWSLYRGALTLRAVKGAVSPEPNLAKPWRKLK